MTQQKSDMQKHFEQQMRDLQQRMDQFEQQARQAQDEAQEEIRQQMDDLRERREHLEAQLEDVRNAGDDVFQTMAKNVEQTIKDFGSALDNVFVQSKPKNTASSKPKGTPPPPPTPSASTSSNAYDSPVTPPTTEDPDDTANKS